MKKGENAAESMRECAADLWRKGATLEWPVPQNGVVIGAAPVPCSCMRMDQSQKLMWRLVDQSPSQDRQQALPEPDGTSGRTSSLIAAGCMCRAAAGCEGCAGVLEPLLMRTVLHMQQC